MKYYYSRDRFWTLEQIEILGYHPTVIVDCNEEDDVDDDLIDYYWYCRMYSLERADDSGDDL